MERAVEEDEEDVGAEIKNHNREFNRECIDDLRTTRIGLTYLENRFPECLSPEFAVPDDGIMDVDLCLVRDTLSRAKAGLKEIEAVFNLIETGHSLNKALEFIEVLSRSEYHRIVKTYLKKEVAAELKELKKTVKGVENAKSDLMKVLKPIMITDQYDEFSGLVDSIVGLVLNRYEHRIQMIVLTGLIQEPREEAFQASKMKPINKLIRCLAGYFRSLGDTDKARISSQISRLTLSGLGIKEIENMTPDAMRKQVERGYTEPWTAPPRPEHYYFS